MKAASRSAWASTLSRAPAWGPLLRSCCRPDRCRSNRSARPSSGEMLQAALQKKMSGAWELQESLLLHRCSATPRSRPRHHRAERQQRGKHLPPWSRLDQHESQNENQHLPMKQARTWSRRPLPVARPPLLGERRASSRDAPQCTRLLRQQASQLLRQSLKESARVVTNQTAMFICTRQHSTISTAFHTQTLTHHIFLVAAQQIGQKLVHCIRHRARKVNRDALLWGNLTCSNLHFHSIK